MIVGALLNNEDLTRNFNANLRKWSGQHHLLKYLCECQYCVYTFIGYTKMSEGCLPQMIILKRKTIIRPQTNILKEKTTISLIQQL